ncbi:Retrovirus-related Pol polyprotein from transposon RE1 [Vitis vinifera]|uniref:Retrovirus-related Pol polyprotein from transposon RE1 n=1 Tax=Vitis vinifera TaxID=29760 RepID=A0A438KK12_VITVI|nr:Retrovirus-related Pol polyprotein from transposon RE1 [Vitis vinifera]
MVALGSEHSVAATDQGEALSWGAGGSGRLGHGHESSLLGFFRTSSEYRPRLIRRLEGIKVKNVAAGLLHSACIDENGSVFIFGERAMDKFGFREAKNATAPSMISELPYSKQVACGGYHTCVISITHDMTQAESPSTRKLEKLRALACTNRSRRDGIPTSKAKPQLAASAGLLSASFDLRRQLPSLAETCVPLGKASSSSPVTFLLCLGPDIPSFSSTAVIRPPFRALFDPNVIQSQLASVELWFIGQGYEDHLVTPEDAIPDVDKVQWKKIDAQLCNVLWQSVDPKILNHLCFKFWTQATGLYTNDIQRFYKVVSDIVHVRQQDMDLFTYIGRIVSLKEEFLTLMSFTNGAEAQQIQTDKFFMVLTLTGLRPDLESIRNQILASPSVPSLDDVFARLLRLSSTQTLSTEGPSDSSVCYQLHGRPHRTAHIAQSSDPLLFRPDSAASSTSQSITLTGSDYDAYLRYQAATSVSVASVAQTANGSQTMAKGIGLAHPLPSLPFHSILYAPECPFNLISISKITRTLNCSITFSDKFVILQDRSTGKTIGIGRESQGLYHLTSPSSPAACISTDTPLLIHSRLGHLSLSKFEKMVPRFSTLSSLACESCQLGKHTRVSFPKRFNNRAKSPFELVHTDVWGPCRTASTLGFQYFVTFIDDYSRCTCDNAREYFSTPFTSFMSQHGILHQSSCAHTLQQNGVFEPCYLINRMPSSILHDQIPHSLLFPTQPLYFLPPRVFGCTCFVHTLTLGQDKPSAKATKCIFLGYSRLQKGYRCYFPDTHRYFLSADVTFFEDSPFFSSSESLPISEVYHRRHHVVAPPLCSAEVPDDSLPVPPISPIPALSSTDHLPIALQKGN